MNKENEKEHAQQTMLDTAQEDYRVITELEIFQDVYLSQYRKCLEMANKEIIESGLPYTTADILSACATLFIAWNQNINRIVLEKEKRQEALNKRGK